MHIHLAICIPFADSAESPRLVRPEWALSLAVMSPPMNCNHMFLTVRSVPRDEARNFLVKEALAKGVKYIFFVDDDTAPPFNAIQKLMYELDQDPDLGAIGGVYCTKSNPPVPVVIAEDGGGPHWNWTLHDVFPCIRIGTGCVMIRASVFKDIPEPWFRDVDSLDVAIEDGLVEPTVNRNVMSKFHMTDDVYFFRKFVNAGFKLKAHGGVLPVHWSADGQAYMLPENCYPVQSYLRQQKAKEGQCIALAS